MKHIYRFVKHFIVWCLQELLVLAGIPILAIALLFVPRNATKLPYFLRWFDSWDVGLSGNGDYYASQKDPTGWWARFNWLALRNPINYFNYKYLAVDDHLHEITRSGHDNKTVLTDGGYSYVEMAECVTGKVYYEYILEYKYHLFGKPVSFRFRLGWKFAGRSHDGKYQWVLQFHPFKPE